MNYPACRDGAAANAFKEGLPLIIPPVTAAVSHNPHLRRKAMRANAVLCATVALAAIGSGVASAIAEPPHHGVAPAATKSHRHSRGVELSARQIMENLDDKFDMEKSVPVHGLPRLPSQSGDKLAFWRSSEIRTISPRQQ